MATLGQIILFAGSFAPVNWAICDGSLLPISQHKGLFTLLGTHYGGNGTNNFALPDLRGRVPVHVNADADGLSPIKLGEKDGKDKITLISQNLPAHKHLVEPVLSYSNEMADEVSPDGGSPAVTIEVGMYAETAVPKSTFMNAGAAALGTLPTGESQPFDNRQPYLGLNYIICINGQMPAKN